jgi:D-inositol-3-phosphate glycosyltransferase
VKYTIVVAGDFPTCNTGLGTVMGEGILPALTDLDVRVLGVNYMGDPHPFEGVKAYPAGAFGGQMGENRIGWLVREVRPDVILLFGDLPVIRHWIANSIEAATQIGSKYVAYYPVDAEGLRMADLVPLKECVAHATYTEFAKREVMKEFEMWGEGLDIPIQIKEPRVIGHGVNTSKFFPIEREKARAMMPALAATGVNEDTVIVLNANRNQPRKRIDLTILSYVEALKILREKGSDLDLRLYLHMAIDGEYGNGWECRQVFLGAMRRAGFSTKQVSEKAFLLHSGDGMNSMNTPPVEALNVLYNACDIGINTAEAEGWGLVQHEMAACGKPQITTDYASLRELWADISPYGPMTGQTLSIAVRSSGIDRGMWNKRVAIDPQWAGSAIVAMATDPERSVIGERFRTRALEFQWDAVQQGIRAMVDEALPKMRMSGARFRQDRKREE